MTDDMALGVAALSAALGKLPPYEGTVWRSCAMAETDLPAAYTVGNVVVEPAFVSATKDPRVRMPGSTTYAIASRTGRDISTMSQAPGDAEVVIDAGAMFLVLGLGAGSPPERFTIFLDEVPRDLSPTDLSTTSAPAKRRLAQLQADEDQRRTIPATEHRQISTPNKYDFPVGMDNEGRPRLVVAGHGHGPGEPSATDLARRQ